MWCLQMVNRYVWYLLVKVRVDIGPLLVAEAWHFLTFQLMAQILDTLVHRIVPGSTQRHFQAQGRTEDLKNGVKHWNTISRSQGNF